MRTFNIHDNKFKQVPVGTMMRPGSGLIVAEEEQEEEVVVVAVVCCVGGQYGWSP